MYPIKRNAIDVILPKPRAVHACSFAWFFALAIHRLCFSWPQHKLSITVTDTVGETPPHTDTSKSPRFNTNKKHKTTISPKPPRSEKHCKKKGKEMVWVYNRGMGKRVLVQFYASLAMLLHDGGSCKHCLVYIYCHTNTHSSFCIIHR